MKLFLSSIGIPVKEKINLEHMLGRSLSGCKLAHFVDASDVYPVEKRGFLERRIENFESYGIKVDELRIADGDMSIDKMEDFDIIWLGGGNVWSLNYLIKKNDTKNVLKSLSHKVLAGDSAGAIVYTPTLKHFELADDPSVAPQKIDKGMGFTDVAIVPHWGNIKYEKVLSKIKESLASDGCIVKTITDDEAIVVEELKYE